MLNHQVNFFAGNGKRCLSEQNIVYGTGLKFSMEMKDWIKMVCGACGLMPMKDDENGKF